jgi:MFS family permease
MGSAYFLGFAVSAGITPMISDKLGRKVPYSMSLMVQTCAHGLIIWSNNINGTIAYYLLVGLCAGGRVCIGSMYLAEFLPERFHIFAMTGINCMDATVMIF